MQASYRKNNLNIYKAKEGIEEEGSPRIKDDCDNPFQRLWKNPTATFLERSKPKNYPCGSVDSLDFILTSVYNHHIHWCAGKADTVRQCSPEMALENIRLIVEAENRVKESDTPTIGQERYRNHINHLNIGLTSNHLPTTQRGYGRKIN